MKNNETINSSAIYYKTLVFGVFLTLMLYTPFIFFAFVSDIFRITVFLIIFAVLFINQFSLKYFTLSKIEIAFSYLLLIIYSSSSLYTNQYGDGLRSAVGYSLILFYSYALYFNLNNSKLFRNNFFKIYVGFFLIVNVFIILNFLFNIIFPSINFLTSFFAPIFEYSYLASPFGLSISKYILGINISRNFFFFIEPVYAAPFLLINVFVVGPFILKNRRRFILLNIIGGILTSSFLFFLGVCLIFLFKKWPKFVVFSIVVSFFIFLNINLDFDNSLISSTSSSDRLLRMQIASDVLSNYSLNHYIFGSGYLVTQELEKGISAGFLSSFVEGGMLGLFIPFILVTFYCNKNMVLFLIFFLSLWAIEPFKMPFLLASFALAGALHKENFR